MGIVLGTVHSQCHRRRHTIHSMSRCSSSLGSISHNLLLARKLSNRKSPGSAHHRSSYPRQSITNHAQKIGYAHTAWNGLTDLFLTFLPATMLWSLQINRRTKIGLVFLLSLSLLWVHSRRVFHRYLTCHSAFVGVLMKIVYLNVLDDRGDYTCTSQPSP